MHKFKSMMQGLDNIALLHSCYDKIRIHTAMRCFVIVAVPFNTRQHETCLDPFPVFRHEVIRPDDPSSFCFREVVIRDVGPDLNRARDSLTLKPERIIIF